MAYKKSVLGALAIVVLGMGFSLAHADITPTLSLVPLGDGTTVTVNVTGDPNEAVELFYPKAGFGEQIAFLGDTSAGGTLSTEVSSSADGIVTGAPVYVAVGGINGTVSSTMDWPTVTGTLGGNIAFSETSMVVPVGQSASVTATNNTSGSLYVYNNSNQSVANVNISGNQITAIGISLGSTTVTICSTATGTSNCPSLYITVTNSGSGTLSFSQSTLTIAPGQSVPITVTGGDTGAYTIYNNTDQSLIFASIAGSTVTLSTTASSGTASITVCSTDMTACGIINVTAGTATSGVVTFSQQYPTLAVGQSTTVAIYGSSGSYYISANTNQNAVTASVTGSVLNLSGISTGTSNITVCASTGGCGTISVTASYASNGGALTLSQSNLSLLSGQTLSLTISGGNAPYSLPTPSSSLYSASISGNILSVTGLSSGSAQISVCSAAGGCTWLSLQVNGSSVGTTGALSLSQTNVSLSYGQSTSVSIYGSGSYYVSSNAAPSVATASVSGSTVLLSGESAGADTVTVCQSGGSCASLYVTVGGTTGVVSSGPATLLSFSTPFEVLGLGQSAAVSITGGATGSYYVAYSTNSGVASASIVGNTISLVGGQTDGLDIVVVCASTNTCGALPVAVGAVANLEASGTPVVTGATSVSGYVFTQLLTLGSQGTEVVQLQKKLATLGYFTARDTGYFGALTQQAVEAFQSAHGISPVGYVGPSTRAALNQSN